MRMLSRDERMAPKRGRHHRPTLRARRRLQRVRGLARAVGRVVVDEDQVIVRALGKNATRQCLNVRSFVVGGNDDNDLGQILTLVSGSGVIVSQASRG